TSSQEPHHSVGTDSSRPSSESPTSVGTDSSRPSPEPHHSVGTDLSRPAPIYRPSGQSPTNSFAPTDADTHSIEPIHPPEAPPLLPPGLPSTGTPSLLLDQETVRVNSLGTATPEAIQGAERRFLEEPGWHLTLPPPGQNPHPATPGATPTRLPQAQAMTLANQ